MKRSETRKNHLRHRSKWFHKLAASALAVVMLLSTVAYAAPDNSDQSSASLGPDSAGLGSEMFAEQPSDGERALNASAVIDPAVDAAVDFDQGYDENEIVHILIAMSKPGALEAGFSAEGIAENTEALNYISELREIHTAAAENIAKYSSVGVGFTAGESYSLIADAFGATARYGDIEKIDEYMRRTYGSDYDGVYVTPTYEVQSDDGVVVPNTLSATQMVGATNAWTNGYTGAGTLIAVIDTGLDPDHPSFDEDAFLFGVAETSAKTGKQYDLLTKEDIANKIKESSDFHVNDAVNNLDNLYVSQKVPFAYNYRNSNYDTSHDHDKAGDHGTHVAGISAANQYVKKDLGEHGEVSFEKQEDGVIGIAPDAQLAVMKVFGDDGGTSAEYYMPAIEDAIWLGCDVINLSLGSTAPGLSYDTSEYSKIFDDMVSSESVVVFSAGNNDYWPQHNLANSEGLDFAEDIHMHTGGSCGSYTNSFTVASDTNTTLTGFGGTFNGRFAIVTDGANAGNPAWQTLDTSAPEDSSGTAYKYIFVGDPADPNDTAQYGADSAYTEDLKADIREAGENGGKGAIVIVSRGGGVNFSAKHMAAQTAGAAGCIVYNNTAGTISMTLEGSTATIPCASIQQRDGNIILEASERDGHGFYAGEMIVKKAVSTVENDDGYTMSDFSSWGTTGNLAIKPEITAPGGNIYSSVNDGNYGVMSGTSMSAPSITGQSALVAQYIQEKGLLENANVKQDFTTQRALITSLLMSTAAPIRDPSCGAPYSVRQQGAGLGSVDAAVATPAYIVMDLNATDSYKDGKVKAELGDDPDEKGVYSFSFQVRNMTGDEVDYVLDATMMTPEIISKEGVKYMSLHSKLLDPQVDFTVNGEIPTDLIYDFNGDGAVSKEDAEVVNRHVSGDKSLSSIQESMADLDSDGYVTSIDVYLLLKMINENSGHLSAAEVTLPANGSLAVDVTITLSEADRTYFNDNNPNGAYVEGFVRLNGEISLTVPVLAYYGNFTDPPMYDRAASVQSYYQDPESRTKSYVDANNLVNFMVMSFSGTDITQQDYRFGMNLFAADDRTFSADRNFAISPDSILSAVCPTFIREPDVVRVSIESYDDPNTVYWQREFSGVPGAFYNTSTSAWAYTYSPLPLGTPESPEKESTGWNVTDANGEPLADGTKVRVSVTAVPELYACVKNDEDGNPVRTIDETKTLGKGATQEYILTVDSNKPTIVSNPIYKPEGNTLEVTVQDAEYVAAVQLRRKTEDGTTKLVTSVPVGQDAKGAQSTVSIDMTGIYGTEFIVAAVDFAGNVAQKDVTVTGHEPGPEPNEDYDNNIYALINQNGGGSVFAKVDPQTGILSEQKTLNVKMGGQTVSVDWQSAVLVGDDIYCVANTPDPADPEAGAKSFLYRMDYPSLQLDPSSGLTYSNNSDPQHPTPLRLTSLAYGPASNVLLVPAYYDNGSGGAILGAITPGEESAGFRGFDLKQLLPEGMKNHRISAVTYLYSDLYSDTSETYGTDTFLAVDTEGNCFYFNIAPVAGSLMASCTSAGKCGVACGDEGILNSALIKTAESRKVYSVVGTEIVQLSPAEGGSGVQIAGAENASAVFQLRDKTLDKPSAETPVSETAVESGDEVRTESGSEYRTAALRDLGVSGAVMGQIG